MNPLITHHYDFIYLFEVQDGNPNGDPDAGNLPGLTPRPTAASSPKVASNAKSVTTSSSLK